MSHRRNLLLQLDGKLPNLALMRLSAYLKQRGELVEFRRVHSPRTLERGLFDEPWTQVYASLIFDRTRPIAERLRTVYPTAVIGGTGWNRGLRLEDLGVFEKELDYSLYPEYRHSIGFTQRGCRLRCPFCCVPEKEGRVRDESSISEIWRGEPHPKNLLLLDNDFFGTASWRERIYEIRDGHFRVCFNQGINARLLDEETAAALASVQYSDDNFRTRRIYTAWDNRKDEARFFAGLDALVRHGVRPGDILVYVLIGYWLGETHQDREYRRRRLREFGALPYPMPYSRNPELVGFQRWVVRRADLHVSWEEYCKAHWRPERLGRQVECPTLFPILQGEDHPWT
ncbi:MAG: radical SAM protein [Bryobacterales bacterium]|nr:radical SAM protein [Bryobacterales bacterium]